MKIKKDAFKGLTHLNGAEVTLAMKGDKPTIGKSGTTKMYNLVKNTGAGVFLSEGQVEV